MDVTFININQSEIFRYIHPLNAKYFVFSPTNKRRALKNAADLIAGLQITFLTAKDRQFFLLHPTNERIFYNSRLKNVMAQTVEKITRQRLRSMADGETLTVTCANGYDLDSQKNTAYFMQKMENCRFTCKTKGLTLIVTRLNN